MLTLDDLKKLESKKIISLIIHPYKASHDIIIVDKDLKVTPSEWNKIREKLKKCGFKYMREYNIWHCDLVNGKWAPSF